jgi:hypothetical protein
MPEVDIEFHPFGTAATYLSDTETLVHTGGTTTVRTTNVVENSPRTGDANRTANDNSRVHRTGEAVDKTDRDKQSNNYPPRSMAVSVPEGRTVCSAACDQSQR